MNSDETNAVAAQAAPSSPVVKEEVAEVSAAAPETTQQTSSAEAGDDAAVEKQPEEPENMDANVRIAKDSSVRKLISFVMGRLERGGTVTL